MNLPFPTSRTGHHSPPLRSASQVPTQQHKPCSSKATFLILSFALVARGGVYGSQATTQHAVLLGQLQSFGGVFLVPYPNLAMTVSPLQVHMSIRQQPPGTIATIDQNQKARSNHWELLVSGCEQLGICLASSSTAWDYSKISAIGNI